MRLGKLVTLTVGLVLSVASNLFAETGDASGHGYVFAAPGRITGESMLTLHFGGGAETPTTRGFGVGVELGYLAPVNYLADGFGVFSANGSYHFGNTAMSSKAIPFLTLGYSLGFRSGTVNGFNVGGGINYWFTNSIGVVLEFRDHAFDVSRRSAHFDHFYEFRFGWTFR
jgi:hypothetical protein